MGVLLVMFLLTFGRSRRPGEKHPAAAVGDLDCTELPPVLISGTPQSQRSCQPMAVCLVKGKECMEMASKGSYKRPQRQVMYLMLSKLCTYDTLCR